MASVLRLAAGRGRQYLLAEPTDRHHADIAIVDMDQQRAVRDWRNCLGADERMPALQVAAEPPSMDTEGVCIRRPITVKRLLDGLDGVTIRSFRYVPELTIQDDNDGAAFSDGAIAEADRTARTTLSSGMRALVVDDSPPVRKLMSIKLGLFGIEVDLAETGEEALLLVRDQHYDIVFLDLTLPGIDGYSVCKSIRRTRELRDLQVVMLTARGSRIDRIRGTMAGCSAYLTKPVEQESLHAILKQFLSEDVANADQQGARG